MSAVSLTRNHSLPLPGLSHPPSKADGKDRRAEEFVNLCREQGIEKGVTHLREQWAQGRHPFPSSFETLISNPNYLATWSAVNSLNAASQAITDVQDRECVSMAFSTGATLLALLDGMTTYAGLQRYRHAQDALKSSLTELAQALVDKNLSPFQRATIKGTCAKNIQAALGLNGVRELLLQVQADGLMAIHGAIIKAADIALLTQVMEDAGGLSQMCEDPTAANQWEDARNINQLLYPNGREGLPVIPKLKAGISSEHFLNQVKVQEDNFAEQAAWLKENTAFGLWMNGVSFVRGLAELFRFKVTRGFLKEKRNAIAQGIEKLKNLPGIKVLTHLFHAARLRLKSNSAAMTGAVARILNAVGGGILKGLTLGGVLVGPAGTVLSAVVLAIYAVKAYAQRYYDRLAGHNESEVANAFKMAANTSPEELEIAIAQVLVQDLQALAGDMDNIKAFLQAMDHPELFDDFSAKFEKAANDKEKLALLKKLLDACMPTADGPVKNCMTKSSDARHQLIGHCMPDPPLASSDGVKARPKALSKSGTATWAEKLFRNPSDKAIASLSGKYPGLHMRMGHSTPLSIEAEKHLARVYGDTPATQQLTTLSRALGANKALVKNRLFIHAFLKGRTWELSPQGKDVQQAFESGSTKQLKGTTLVAALSQSDADLDNHHLIASCRFDKTSQAQDHAHLVAQLRAVCTEKSHAHLKTMVEAMETCQGKPLLDLARKMQKTEVGKAQFQRLFEMACMLIVPSRSAAHAASIHAALFEGRNPATLSRDDLSNALAIVTRQRLHARIGDTHLRTAIEGLLAEEGSISITSGDTVFVKSPNPDARWDLYADDVIAGKARLEHAPDWLLPAEFKTLLKDRKLGKTCQAALREQFQIGVSHAPEARQPISLLWPATVLGKKTAALQKLQGLWQHAFAPLAGVDASGRTWSDLKAAAALYKRCQEGKFSLSDLEKLIKAHKKDRNPEKQLTIQLALQWLASPWSAQLTDKDTVQALMDSKNSEAFVKVLKDKVKSTPDTKKHEELLDATRAEKDAIFSELLAHFENSTRDKERSEPRRRPSLHIPPSDTQDKLLASTAELHSAIAIARRQPPIPSRMLGDMPMAEPDTEPDMESVEATHPFDESLIQYHLIRRSATV